MGQSLRSDKDGRFLPAKRREEIAPGPMLHMKGIASMESDDRPFVVQGLHMLLEAEAGSLEGTAAAIHAMFSPDATCQRTC